MATNLTTLSDMGKKLVATAMHAREAQTNLEDTTFQISIVGGNSIVVPKIAFTVAGTAADGANFSDSTLYSNTNTTLLVDTHAGKAIPIGMIADATSPVTEEAARNVGISIQAKVNQDIFGKFTSFTADGGNVNATITVARTDAALDTLIAADLVGADPVYFVATPKVMRKWVSDLETNYDTVMPETIKQDIYNGKYRSAVRGLIPITVASGITDTGSNVSAGVYTSRAIAFATIKGLEVSAKEIETDTGKRLVIARPYDVEVVDNTRGIRIGSKAS